MQLLYIPQPQIRRVLLLHREVDHQRNEIEPGEPQSDHRQPPAFAPILPEGVIKDLFCVGGLTHACPRPAALRSGCGERGAGPLALPSVMFPVALTDIEFAAGFVIDLAHLFHALARRLGLLRRGFALDVLARQIAVRALPRRKASPPAYPPKPAPRAPPPEAARSQRSRGARSSCCRPASVRSPSASRRRQPRHPRIPQPMHPLWT